MELKEEIFPEQSPAHQGWMATHKLTKLWFALFFFTLAINTLPYLPFWPDQSSEAQFVTQTNHAAICSSSAVREASRRGDSSLLLKAATGSVPGTLKIQETLCLLPVLDFMASANSLSDIFVVGVSLLPLPAFSPSHPSRGPPRA